MWLKIKFFYEKLLGSMSFRAALFCLISIFVVFSCRWLGAWVPQDIIDIFSPEALDQLLKIISSSMLVVVTFSLSIVVTAYASASKDMTPRATQLLIKDSHSQTSISIFLGSFIFSIVALINISFKNYRTESKVILFFMTIVLIFCVIWTIIRWLDQLRRLGRVNETIDKIETALKTALLPRAKYPTFKCQRYSAELSPGKYKVCSKKVGFVEFINFENLSEIANQEKIEIKIEVELGDFISLNHLLVTYDAKSGDVDQKKKESLNQKILAEFSVSKIRSFERDPRFGFVVLSEVASKALSPGINDPGTAITVISSAVRCFCDFFDTEETDDLEYDQVCFKSLDLEDLFQDAFLGIARDGRSFFEVMYFLQKGIKMLCEINGDSKKALGSLIKIHQEYIEKSSLTSSEKERLKFCD